MLADMLLFLSNNAAAFYTVTFIFGLVVGSFLNVVIHRIPIMLERSWYESAKAFLLEENANNQIQASKYDKRIFNLLYPNSYCPHCKQPVKAWQNIPLISYGLLLGKCQHCKTPISLRYPLIELIAALLCLAITLRFGLTLESALSLMFTWTLLCLSVIDYDHHLLPDQLTLPLLWVGLLASTQSLFTTPTDAILGASLGYLSLWSVYWIFKLITGKEGMGYGDFKLLAALGAWCGWQALPSIIVWSSLVGAIIGIGLVVLYKRDRNKPIPFGPYLAIAGWLYFYFGDNIDIQQWMLLPGTY